MKGCQDCRFQSSKGNLLSNITDMFVLPQDAVAGSLFKAGLDLVPFLVAPLGLAGIPVFVAAQIGGRWLIAEARQSDNKLRSAIDKALASSKEAEKRHEAIMAECEQTDLLFERVMGRRI